jgi:hypothetical protein
MYIFINTYLYTYLGKMPLQAITNGEQGRGSTGSIKKKKGVYVYMNIYKKFIQTIDTNNETLNIVIRKM